ncbi:MAG TPA: 50S ribosomal protein L22 [Firmicutes bacterium]|nr:50S ribosomal protein L22 [Bacillota bacterium]HHY98473.1 50S ribosomal protein L22 [Bacillota bacterium]
MEAKAHAKYVRISPRKVRRVVDLIRGKDATEALVLLRHLPEISASVVEKVLKSAVANAEHNLELNRRDLYVAEAYVNQGPTMKRWRARMRGMPAPIRKRSSHITVIVREKEG